MRELQNQKRKSDFSGIVKANRLAGPEKSLFRSYSRNFRYFTLKIFTVWTSGSPFDHQPEGFLTLHQRYVTNFINWSAVNTNTPNIRWQATLANPRTLSLQAPNSSFKRELVRSAAVLSLQRSVSGKTKFSVLLARLSASRSFFSCLSALGFLSIKGLCPRDSLCAI